MKKSHERESEVWLEIEGKQVLDLTSGGGAAILGFKPKSVMAALKAQNLSNPHIMPYTPSPLSVRLEKTMCDLFELPNFTSLPATSGTEAVDLALRLARRVTGRRRVVYCQGAYHGSTSAAIACCGIANWQHAQEDLWGNIAIDLPWRSDPDWLTQWQKTQHRLEQSKDEIAAIIFEPLQSNRGFLLPPLAYVQRLCDWAHANGILFIADEIGSSLGRGGHWLGSQHYGIEVDMALLGKNLGSGVFPIAVVLAKQDHVRAAIGPGFRSSMSWTPVACAVALATLKTIQEQGLLNRSQALGATIENILGVAEHSQTDRIVGTGLGWGIRLGRLGDDRAREQRLAVAKTLRERGILVEPNPCLPGIRMMPALTIPEAALVDAMVKIKHIMDGF